MTRHQTLLPLAALAAVVAVLIAAPAMARPAPATVGDAPGPAAAAASGAVVARSVAIGASGGCARMSDGTVRCWGQNSSGDVGDGTLAIRRTPVAVIGIADARALTMTNFAACAVVGSGHVRCWGSNGTYQLGDPDDAGAHPVPWEVPGIADATDVVTGGYHTCALRTGGTVTCWGSDTVGQSGGSGNAVTAPHDVAGISGATALAVGSATTCALLGDRTVRCWGAGTAGELGHGAMADSSTPVAVQGLTEVKQIVAGDRHACALRFDGTVRCWGANTSGDLGDGTDTPRATPVAVAGLADVASLATGFSSTCASRTDGSLACWGDNTSGHLGDGTTTPRLTPTTVNGIGGVRAATIGRETACARSSGGTVRCWGANGAGQLGDGTAQDRPAPVVVSGLAGAPPWPFASWDALVDQLFLDMTGKAPSAADRSQFSTALQSGALTRGWASDALRQRPDSTSTVDPAVRLYRAFLGRAPDHGGLSFWIARRRTGTWTLVRMANHFAASSEFRRTYGDLSNRQFVTRIYVDVLGRTADAGGVDYWTRQLDLGRRSRGSVMVGFSESSEYRRLQAVNTDLAVAYFFHLKRAPNATETLDWTARQTAGTPRGDLLDELLDGDAHAARATG